ncbi:MAG: hypothetical protein QOH04_1073 [Sphingomonadales bacterium]|nr:hypothetical protein [Sphingomonadales bacterium]
MRMIWMAAALAATIAPAAAEAGRVIVDLNGLRAGGTAYVQLQTRAQFMGPDRVGGQIVRVAAAGALSVDLGEVAPGDYAVSVWHDDNDNQRFDMAAQGGAPLDGWAIANGSEAGAGPPDFDRAKVTVAQAPLRLPMTLHYGR